MESRGSLGESAPPENDDGDEFIAIIVLMGTRTPQHDDADEFIAIIMLRGTRTPQHDDADEFIAIIMLRGTRTIPRQYPGNTSAKPRPGDGSGAVLRIKSLVLRQEGPPFVSV